MLRFQSHNTSDFVRTRRFVLGVSVCVVVCFFCTAKLSGRCLAMESGTEVTDGKGHFVIHRLTGTVLTGGTPTKEKAFARLRQMGVKTIVSVDGARPNVELAKRNGLRYIHIPIGYNGIEKDDLRALSRIGSEKEWGTTYVHCHHGRHRGPVAATVIGLARQETSKDKAIEFLKQVGTGAKYSGLWEAIRKYEIPEASEEPPELVSIAKRHPMTECMATMDHTFDRLRDATKDLKNVTDAKESWLRKEGVVLKEGFLESKRFSKQMHGSPFEKYIDDSIALTDELLKSIRSKNVKSMQKNLLKIKSNCTQCHERYRDGGVFNAVER